MVEYFTPEEKEKIADYLPYTITAPVEFTPPEFAELPEEKRPVFILQQINSELEEQFYNLYDKIKAAGATGTSREIINCWIKVGLKGFRNWRSADGEEIKYAVGADEMVTDEILSAMRIHFKSALHGKITGA